MAKEPWVEIGGARRIDDEFEPKYLSLKEKLFLFPSRLGLICGTCGTILLFTGYRCWHCKRHFCRQHRLIGSHKCKRGKQPEGGFVSYHADGTWSPRPSGKD